MSDPTVRAGLALLAGLWCISAAAQVTLAERNTELMRELQEVHGLSPQQMDRVRAIFAGSRIIGQGNPAITQHPVTAEQCRDSCGYTARAMRILVSSASAAANSWPPLYDPVNGRPEDAQSCIDQFEFPDIPCAYPVVWG